MRKLSHSTGRCFYCSTPVYKLGSPEVIADINCEHTRDHYWPCMMGSQNLDPTNVVVACRGCNSVKSNHPPTLFLFFMKHCKTRDMGQRRLEMNRFAFEMAQFGLIAARERWKYLKKQDAANDEGQHIYEPRARDSRGRYTKRDLRRA